MTIIIGKRVQEKKTKGGRKGTITWIAGQTIHGSPLIKVKFDDNKEKYYSAGEISKNFTDEFWK